MELAQPACFHVLNVRIAQYATHALEGTFSQGQVARHVSITARHATALHIALHAWRGITLRQVTCVRPVLRPMLFASIATRLFVKAVSWGIS